MKVLRSATLLTVLGLFVLAAASSTATAAEYPDVGGCGADDVEVCQPVCITTPCYGYVCVRTNLGEVCQRV